MSSLPLFLLLLATVAAAVATVSATAATTPYLSPTTLFKNYHLMQTTFKIYTYPVPVPATPTLFHTLLLSSPFATANPDEAHLFYLPFPSDLPSRGVARLVREVRGRWKYWNRTLGADHFYVSDNGGLETLADRNMVELKKNSVQITVFPTYSGLFIPHKDITLPPISDSPLVLPEDDTNEFSLGYLRVDKTPSETLSSFVDQLKNDPDFVVDSEPFDGMMKKSKFCLFVYGSDMTWMVEAMAVGCVPAVITDRPIQDLPLMDVIRWSEVALFVGSRGGIKGLKVALRGISQEKWEQMSELAEKVSQHMVWNEEPQPQDAFHMVMYQLWLRRHTIRYATREWEEA